MRRSLNADKNVRKIALGWKSILANELALVQARIDEGRFLHFQ
jgi:hypothetical protein